VHALRTGLRDLGYFEGRNIRSAVLLALSPEAAVKLVDAPQYEKRVYIYMGATLVLGLYLTYAGFSA
jgi:hypothetical protein